MIKSERRISPIGKCTKKRRSSPYWIADLQATSITVESHDFKRGQKLARGAAAVCATCGAALTFS